MRLLIVTQKVDKNDSVLGFFHTWVEKLAPRFDFITVICLYEGEHDLPANVKVLSLGKENGVNRVKYISNFYKFILSERDNYDAVFVHMNQEYVLLGAPIWKLFGKKVFMWRNHSYGNIFTCISVVLSDRVFCTSTSSYTARFRKTRIMPAGIDVSSYEGGGQRNDEGSLLFFGRISPVKNVHLFIEALLRLYAKGVVFHADIIGSPSDRKGQEYEKEIHALSAPLVGNGILKFYPGISPSESKALYKKYDLYVNLTPDGSLDKTMMESMASGTPILVSNSAFKGEIPEVCIVSDTSPEAVSLKIESFFTLSSEEKKTIGESLKLYVSKSHDLNKLVDMLARELSHK